MAQRGRGRGRGAAAWEALAARVEAAERERAARGVGRGRGAALVPAPGVVAGAGHGGGGIGPGAAAAAAGRGRAGPVAVAAGNGAGGGAGGAAAEAGNGAGGGGGARGVGGGGRPAAAAGNPLGRWLVGNTNHGANPQRLPSTYGGKIDPNELEVYSADEYLTGEPEVDDLYIRLASLYNSYGDNRVLMFEKEADGNASRHDRMKYRKEEAQLMEQIGILQQSLRNLNAKPYPIPKTLYSDTPF